MQRRLSHFRRRHQAFTLIELLVMVAIVVLLIGLLLPMVLRSLRQGAKTRQAADLNTIAIALEAYKADFGDYPRLPVYPSTDPRAGQPIPDTGAATLGKALIGPFGDGKLDAGGVDPNDPPSPSSGEHKPGEAVFDGSKYWVCVRTNSSAPATPDWAEMSPIDGADGPGFRSRRGGKVWGPYLKAENFNMKGLDLCDKDGNPILYFPATPGNPNVSKAHGYVDSRVQNPLARPLYNADDNITIFRRAGETNNENALTRIQCFFGDYDGIYANAQLIASIASQYGHEIQRASSGFVLWAAGPDGLFGPTDVINNVGSADDWKINEKVSAKCDDVTNFR